MLKFTQPVFAGWHTCLRWGGNSFVDYFDAECRASAQYVRGKSSKSEYKRQSSLAKEKLRTIFSQLNKREIGKGLQNNSALINEMGEILGVYAKSLASKWAGKSFACLYQPVGIIVRATYHWEPPQQISSAGASVYWSVYRTKECAIYVIISTI